MRAFVLILLAAFLNATTVAAFAAEPAAQPPDSLADRLATDLPSAINAELPNLSSPADLMLSKREQYELGYSVMLQMRQQNKIFDDPETAEYVQQIGQRLASQSADGGGYFHYIVLKSHQINSFAVTGGWVFIFTGVITASHTESELAAVMAHETAHITQNHVARKLEESKRATMTSLAAMLGAVLLGALGGGGGQAIEGGIVASQGLAEQQQINYSRSVEEEADRVGIQYLAAAGFDPEAMADFFSQLMREQGMQDSWVPAMLQDHPVDRERIADARERAAQYPPVPDTSSPDYYLIKARVRVLTAPGYADIQRQYAQKIAEGNHSLGTMYGDALALMQDDKAAQAVPILKKLIAQHGELHLLYSALGQAQAQAGDMRQALATFRLAMRLFPHNVPVTVRYAQTLMADGRNSQAHEILLDLFNNVDPTPDQIELTARAASAAGDLGDAYYYMGIYQTETGNLPLAAQQYQLALATPHLTYVQRERISANLRQVRDYLAKAHRERQRE
ncbi:MAG TPA: M48 family metalloprotease [Steroidobacteraceae bacterium]|nr:M48 family metalloprotease [Steroidobacteraceae bacterium]